MRYWLVGVLLVFPLPASDTGVRVLLQDNQSAVRVPLPNSTSQPLTTTLDLEWLSPSDEVISKLTQQLSIPPGGSQPIVAFPLPAAETQNPIWYRLRYRARTGAAETSETLSLPTVAEHVFELQITTSQRIVPGDFYRVIIRTLHPLTGRAVAGVAIRGAVEMDGRAVQVRGMSDASGVVSVEFPIPPKTVDDRLTLDIAASLGDFTQTYRSEPAIDRHLRIRIDTDKPRYQPGQDLHIRLLCRNAASRAAAELPLTVSVKDPEGTAVFVASLVTNRFGVAAADWRIPANARLGDYVVEAADFERTVKVSRYDLPSFAVTAKADRAYYLRGQQAFIEGKADYLFGRPITRGSVRVAGEKLGVLSEGVLDASGRFRARLNLDQAFLRYPTSQWTPFEDLPITVDVRDLSTGRSEQRRLDLRITEQAIHLYRIGRDYISATYADGTPAACQIRINGLTTVSTNRYGLARVQFPNAGPKVELVAQDGQGLRGRHTWTVYESEPSPGVRIETGHTLFRTGESIHAVVTSSSAATKAMLVVLAGGRLVESVWLDLSSGTATIELPWRKAFVREVTLAVALWDTADHQSSSRTVLFPVGREEGLGLKIQPERSTYRPGEEASVGFRTVTSEGIPVEAAVGVAVVDAAVGRPWSQEPLAELGGLTREDLYRLEPSQPFASDVDLLAEVMLLQDNYGPDPSGQVQYSRQLQNRFAPLFRSQFKPLTDLLDAKYRRDYHYPQDVATLQRDAAEAGIRFDALRDPWDRPFFIEFETEGPLASTVIRSPGPDREAGTRDDLTAVRIQRQYFEPNGHKLRTALMALPSFPLTEEAARTALRTSGVPVEELKDPWGSAYRLRIEIERDRAVLRVQSAGPDRVAGTSDDFDVEWISGPYFVATERRIGQVLQDAKDFPMDETSWKTLLRSAALEPLVDPWGVPVYPVFQVQSKYSDLQRLYRSATFGSKAEPITDTVPATEKSRTIYLRSVGPDGTARTEDDFDLAVFTRTEKVELPAQRIAARRAPPKTPLQNGGMVIGQVTDVAGGVVARATVRAVRTNRKARNELEYGATTDPNGLFVLGGLPPGRYEVRLRSPGFQLYVMKDVPVSVGKSTVANAELDVAAVQQILTVVAQPALVQTSASTAAGQAVGVPAIAATPRLREYFPETLLWAPLVETDASGNARLKFRLADTITTWKVEAIASAANGDIGIAEAEVRAFQPLFLELEPPKILTQCDEVDQTVTARNYRESKQEIQLSLKPEPWFQVKGKSQKELLVAPGAVATSTFLIRAVATVGGGKQRVTAMGQDAGDAIEKTVSVHPDGHEVSEHQNTLMTDSAVFPVAIPKTSLAGTLRTEVKIYPNLLDHVMGAMGGVLKRPHGCAEQTISSAYPSLMLLQSLAAAGVKEHALQGEARRYLKLAVDSLAGYQVRNGAFTYWGSGDGDVALTAYALTFLRQAREFTAVEETRIERARHWLLKQQSKDGAGTVSRPDARGAAYSMVEAGRALASAGDTEGADRALKFLAPEGRSVDEPYLIASMVLLAQQAKQHGTMQQLLASLRRLAVNKNGLTYWDQVSPTSFYGWGLAGRLETTALALKALLMAGDAADRPLIDSGLLYLLNHKDRYGVWLSTQATVKVLDALLSARTQWGEDADADRAEVLVDGKPVAEVSLPAPTQRSGPLKVDLSSFVTSGSRQVMVRRGKGRTPAHVQLVNSYYVPWEGVKEKTGPLDLQVTFDKTNVRPGDTVSCRVAAERKGARGYGMMIAEIGLPPGADVDSQSLDAAMQQSNRALNRYEIQSDRLVLYLWSGYDRIHFEFRFQPRLAMKAKSAPSVLYDYYNPDARVVVKPVQFDRQP